MILERKGVKFGARKEENEKMKVLVYGRRTHLNMPPFVSHVLPQFTRSLDVSGIYRSPGR